jgi:glycosyltransferase involved in cell wall biosynthesis
MEVIVVDDFSNDIEMSRALDRLSAHALIDLNVLRLSQNSGPSVARNTGWAAATQEYVAFLDADDVWAPRKLELQFPLMEEDRTLSMSGHRMEVRDESGGSTDQSLVPLHVKSFTSTQLLFRNRLSTPTVILRRDIPFRFNPERRYSEDYELWLRVALMDGRFKFLDVPLAFSFKAFYGESGLSSELRRMEKGQTSVYRTLFREHAFSTAMFITLLLWGKVRFVRRIAITLLRKALQR